MPEDKNDKNDKNDINLEELLFKDINWTGEILKYRKDYEKLFSKCIDEKTATLKSKPTDKEKLEWCLKAVINAAANFYSAYVLLVVLCPESTVVLTTEFFNAISLSGAVCAHLYKHLILEKKKEEREVELKELERML